MLYPPQGSKKKITIINNITEYKDLYITKNVPIAGLSPIISSSVTLRVA